MDIRRTAERLGTDTVQALVGESMLELVPGLGASLAVTPTRVVLVREGAARRPRTGLRAWPHGTVAVRMEPPRGGNGRIVLGSDAGPSDAVSLFVPAGVWPDAVRAVERIRAEARHARRTASSGGLKRRSDFRVSGR